MTRKTFAYETENTILATRLREIFSGENQADIGKKFGVSAQAVGQWMSGLSNPKINNLVDISKFYNISVDYLLGLTDVKTLNKEILSASQLTGLDELSIKLLQTYIGYSNDGEYTLAVRPLVNKVIHNDRLSLIYRVHQVNKITEDLKAYLINQEEQENDSLRVESHQLETLVDSLELSVFNYLKASMSILDSLTHYEIFQKIAEKKIDDNYRYVDDYVTEHFSEHENDSDEDFEKWLDTIKNNSCIPPTEHSCYL